MRARLAHVLWIGGGPQAGKTTLSRLLAGKWDLKIYDLDWHAVREHGGRPGPAVAAFQRLSMDERWAIPSADELLERSVTIWQDGFALVLVERGRALTNVSARDALLDARIVSSCAELGLRCERLDGSLDLDDSLALVEDHFRGHLPAMPNV